MQKDMHWHKNIEKEEEETVNHNFSRTNRDYETNSFQLLFLIFRQHKNDAKWKLHMRANMKMFHIHMKRKQRKIVVEKISSKSWKCTRTLCVSFLWKSFLHEHFELKKPRKRKWINLSRVSNLFAQVLLSSFCAAFDKRIDARAKVFNGRSKTKWQKNAMKKKSKM